MEGVVVVVVVGAMRRLAAARAARAWARSSWSSLEPRKNGLVGDWSRVAIGALCVVVVGLGLNGSSAIDVLYVCVCLCVCVRERERERERERGKILKSREGSGYFPILQRRRFRKMIKYINKRQKFKLHSLNLVGCYYFSLVSFIFFSF